MIDAIYRVIDVETTGLEPPPASAVVEVASLDLLDDRLGEARSTLVNPGMPIPPEASAIHGITDADVADAPFIDEAIPLVVTDGEPNFFVAHNASFELLFLADSLKVPVICTMKVAMRVWPEAREFNLSYLRYWLSLGDLGARATPVHRGPADVFVAAHVFMRARDHASIEEMVEWSKIPAVHPRVMFGMHEGKQWSGVPDSYLDWILNKAADMDAEKKWNAQQEVDRRIANGRERYVIDACAEAKRCTSVTALEQWFLADDHLRIRFGALPGTDAYNRIVRTCVDVKKNLLAPQKPVAEGDA